jgi:prevent-host-death family protein
MIDGELIMRAQNTIATSGGRPTTVAHQPIAEDRESRFNNDGFIMMTSVELNRNSGAVLRQASEGTVCITRHQKAVAYLVSSDEWQQIGRRIKELEFRLICAGNPDPAI